MKYLKIFTIIMVAIWIFRIFINIWKIVYIFYFNFRIKVENSEEYVLKISRPDEDEAYLDFQQKIIQYIEN